MKRIFAMILALSMLALVLCSCAKTQVEPKVTRGDIPKVEPTNAKAAGDLLKDFVAIEVEGKDADDKFKSGMLDFAVRLMQSTLDENKKSSLVSPLSVIVALGMTANGANGETKEEFEKLFGFSLDEANAYLYTLAHSLYNGDGAKVELANSIWFGKDGRIAVHDDFLQVNKNYYDAQAYEEDFFSQKTVDKINKWVSKHTDKMIDQIIDSIDPDTVMLLINALVFDALWSKPYENFQCQKGTFNAYGKSKSDATFMTSEETLIRTKNAIGFRKYYKNGYEFVAMLPDGDVFDYVNSLSGKKLGKILSGKQNDYGYRAKAYLPKFEYDYDVSLYKALESMGLKKAFSSSEADLSGIGSSPLGNLYIGDVLHKTHIEMTQAGTRAAAVTAVEILAESAAPKKPVDVKLDRPFVYYIVDCNTNLPIFMGVVTEIN